MKKILITAMMLLVSSMSYAANSVMVDNNGILLYPTNFFSTNGVQTTNAIVPLTARVTTLEAVQISESNSFNARINSATNDIKVLQTNVAVISTNYTTLANGILGTNAYYRIGVLETNRAFPQGINTTNTITALSFAGNGSGLTNLTASVTGAISQITIGTSNMIGAVTFNGVGVETTNNALVTVAQVEYLVFNIAPISTSYELTWLPVFDEDCTLQKITAKCDNYNVTFDMVKEATNDAWRTYVTNTAPIIAVPQGVFSTTFVDSKIASNTMHGIRVIDLDPRATNLVVTVKIKR